MAMVKLDDSTRDRLRRYKAEDGQTYSEAVDELLDMAGWMERDEHLRWEADRDE